MSWFICIRLHKKGFSYVYIIKVSSGLQEIGVKIKIDEQDNIFRGSIGPFASDNLGAHCIGGFIEGLIPLEFAESVWVQTMIFKQRYLLHYDIILAINSRIICSKCFFQNDVHFCHFTIKPMQRVFLLFCKLWIINNAW